MLSGNACAILMLPLRLKSEKRARGIIAFLTSIIFAFESQWAAPTTDAKRKRNDDETVSNESDGK